MVSLTTQRESSIVPQCSFIHISFFFDFAGKTGQADHTENRTNCAIAKVATKHSTGNFITKELQLARVVGFRMQQCCLLSSYDFCDAFGQKIEQFCAILKIIRGLSWTLP